MILKCLIENTSISDQFMTEHGLSLYVETGNHKLLFDTGASEKFAANAVRLEVDLSAVDLMVLSHGHYDHGGGLKKFLSLNESADIYLHKEAFKAHYAARSDGGNAYIGIDQSLSASPQLIFCDQFKKINDALTVFSDVKGDLFKPSGNDALFMMEDGALKIDDFNHEQNLVIEEAGKRVLIAGCAHRGIVNIMNHMEAIGLGAPDVVIGGFHLYARSTDKTEPEETVKALGEELLKRKAVYYTCHCTGIKAYQTLKVVMGDRIHYLSAGQVLAL
ncbi:MBL fold metallo-hydrolase [Acidaminobacter hydrogenoformans]|uniref:7,8-dihydropterin-6-yl-methyl-4-(Beta-D-ribofuranosyl)aminobenzene 5'-phosphate synthase n=1 Tax=Acidaminobacter hydrogenoformans DSM 2784 TaxID=1120920 RepID=A0A1G5S1A0_9FIRM|nr:MBL fold metallo-hydrolase [Acidaminobacter hydrogenoformans]SCZ80066.1 7,8-dihydropterin-6-yl-methyl-4-(beta-D-ribofuranosyl)aminobenzene 5'-phosphate synthase [Acidaminobacter hydrogenoformans DSM 2784]